MTLWFLLAAGVALLLWYMVWVPGASHRGLLPPLDAVERELPERLRGHVAAIASREHNMDHPEALEAAAREIEKRLAGFGCAPAAHGFEAAGKEVRNIEVEIAGGARADEIVILGAHYDSVWGAPGANDNGSGVAALLELARLLRDAKPERTVRLVWFVNEEPPYFQGEDMGSRHYARRSRSRGERIVAMFSLETIGWYSDQPGSQRYPAPLGFFYPSTGDFIAFVSNLGSRALMHEAIGAFRRAVAFPSEGVAAPTGIPGVDWSDHGSFWEQGYPAVMITDTALFRYPWYHQREDTPEKLDYDRLARVVRGIHGMTRALARVP
jgi:Zn-dependent M28 family amino/carboxypeptidase